MSIAEYGTWASPISAAMTAASARSIAQLQTDARRLYWVESRPEEGGRQSIMMLDVTTRALREITPAPFNARSRVHEYGGGAYCAHAGEVIFSHDADRQLYRTREAAAAQVLTNQPDCRYADCSADHSRGRWLSVVERHAAGAAPHNVVAEIDAATGAQRTLLSGHDFYAAPRVSPDATQLAWLQWDQPNMPWDGCELWVGRFDRDGGIADAQRVSGGANESIFQPCWAADGSLYFISDASGYWNLYRWRSGEVRAVCPRQLDFGRAQWVFGLTTYACLTPERLMCTYVESGQWRLATFDANEGALRTLSLPYSELSYLCSDGRYGYCVAAAARSADSIIRIDPSDGSHEVLYRSGELPVEEGFIAVPQPVEFPSEAGARAYGFFYAPTSATAKAPGGAAPPLLVIGHGGPTAATSTALNFGIQYWTSRGFAVLDVNYRGSTGYGRAYRDALNGQWGVADVQDCVQGALYLVTQNRAARTRLAIRGRSAGGFTVLAALTFYDVFSAGASYYGVSDLEALAHDTHKFEACYLDRLIGPYPQAADVYRARSPLLHCERLRTPVIFLQGLEDKVVPPNQAERMVEALRAKSVPVAYVTFANEQHGFRRAENIARALEAELYFYSRIWRLPLSQSIDPVRIDNLV